MNKAELSNAEIVVYVIFKLGGNERKIPTEHIAMECFKVAKERFSWRLPEYKEYPDKQHVREALKQAKYFKEGRLITGRSGVDAAGKEVDGWMLTPGGAKWIIKNRKRIESLLKISTELWKSPDIQRVIKWFEQEKCYQKYLQDNSVENINEYEFKDMLLCRPDAQPETIRKEFERLKTKAEITQNKNILSFLNACEEAFSPLMQTNVREEEAP
jgi:hypothetical protein